MTGGVNNIRCIEFVPDMFVSNVFVQVASIDSKKPVWKKALRFLFELCCHSPGFTACEERVDRQTEKDHEFDTLVGRSAEEGIESVYLPFCFADP